MLQLNTKLSECSYSGDSLSLEALSIQNATEEDRRRIINLFNGQGLFIVATESALSGPEKILEIASFLKLGTPYVPGYLNQSGEIKKLHGINKVAVPDTGEGSHTAFSRSGESKLHVDGTYQPIGTIKTSIVLCESNAYEGGKSSFFNATAALKYFSQKAKNPKALNALFNEKALTRATVDINPDNTHTGPVFKFDNDDNLLTRLSLDHVSTWHTEIEGLQEAMDFMIESAQPGSPWYTEFLLEPNQAVVFANSRIAHGRTAYTDTPECKRVMWRGLFTEDPSL